MKKIIKKRTRCVKESNGELKFIEFVIFDKKRNCIYEESDNMKYWIKFNDRNQEADSLMVIPGCINKEHNDYDERGNLIFNQILYNKDNQGIFGFDLFDNEFEERMIYNDNDQLIKSICKDSTETYEYDKNGNCIRITTDRPDGQEVVLNDYDERGNCIHSVMTTSEGIEEWREYDENDRQIH